MGKCCFALLICCLIAYATTTENSNNLKLARFVCDLSEDFIQVEKNVKTIAIIKYKTEIPNSFIDEVGQCMSKDVSLLVMDFAKKLVPLKRLKLSLVILLTDVAERIDVVNMILATPRNPILDHLTKFLLIVNTPDTQVISNLLRNFAEFGGFKVTTANILNDTVMVRRLNPYLDQMHLRRITEKTGITERTFPDPLKNLYGSKFKVGFFIQSSIRINKKGEVHAAFLYFLDALKNAMNSSYETIKFPKFNKDRKLDQALSQRQLDVHITRAVPGGPNPQILSYEKTFYCIYAPRPDKISLLQMMLVEPFEVMIWVSFIVSVLATAFVWRLYKNNGATDSAFYFIFGILVYFIGQSVTFRTSKRMLIMIIQIYMFVTMILSCLYQGEMTSFMTTPLYERRIKTVEEFSKSNLKVEADEFFSTDFAAVNYPEIHRRLIHNENELPYAESRRQKIAFVYACNEFTKKYFNLIFRGLDEHYYLVPETILPYYKFYDACYGNPYYERWQEYMDWSYATGLHTHWEFLLSQEFSYEHEINSIEEEKFYLELGDMAQMFYIFAVGLSAGLLAFLVEIFYTYCCGWIIMRYGRILNYYVG